MTFDTDLRRRRLGVLFRLVVAIPAALVLVVWGALVAALVWSYMAIIRRAVTGQRIPGILVLGTLGITARSSSPGS